MIQIGVKLVKWTEEERRLLENYVTNLDGNVFVVQNLPGLAGAIFARYSRAQTGLRETLLREFIEEEGMLDVKRASDLIERVLIQFGDDSVGELDGIHLALENISNLATKVVEDVRIGGSPIEQSTRYVFYDQKDENGNFKYLRDKRIMESHFSGQFIETMDFIFQTYCDLVEPMQDFFRKLKPIEEAEYDIIVKGQKLKLKDLSDEKDIKAFKKTYKFDIRTRACDTIRILLPQQQLLMLVYLGMEDFIKLY